MTVDDRRRRGLTRWWSRRPAPWTPREAYRRWADRYGDEPNELQQLEAAATADLLPDPRGLRTLDVGCGRGRLAATLGAGGASLSVAADLTLAMLVHARAARDERLFRLAAPTHPLPFRPATFDIVVCALVLGHVADLDGAIEAMAEVLRPGGCLLISDFHPYATLRGWERTFEGRDGRGGAIEQHLHLFEDYMRAFIRLGLTLEDLREPRYQDQPVAFALRARKASGEP